ncbi:unnamed protein product, partial [Mesorhabditis spiculigera]
MTGVGDTVPPWLAAHPAYHGYLPREDVPTLLSKDGSYLVRVTQVSEEGGVTHTSYVISYHLTKGQWAEAQSQQEGKGLAGGGSGRSTGTPAEENMIRHIAVKESNGLYTINEKNLFTSIKELITHHAGHEEMIGGSGLKYKCRLETPMQRQGWEIQHDDIKIEEKLGEVGQFGLVMRGELRRPSGKWVPVALKQTKDDCAASKQKRKEIMAECRLMRGLVHPNVVRFYGVAVAKQPIYIVLELVPGLDLHNYLLHNRGKVNKSQRHGFVAGVAFGIEYIHSQGIIHRDLAARNCLVDTAKNMVKISDFGMSIRASEYELTRRKKGGDVKLPLRWLAPECIIELRYTQKTDVWAFGLIVLEIYAEGKQPYDGKRNEQVKELLNNGVKPQLPKAAGKKLHEYMDNHVFASVEKRALMPDVCNFVVEWSGIQRPKIEEEEEEGT